MAQNIGHVHRVVGRFHTVRARLDAAPALVTAGCAPVIMVQVGAPDWTLNALHRACQLGRPQRAVIALIVMVPVQHTAWLGSSLGDQNLTPRIRAACRGYVETVQDYGLECVQLPFQFVTWLEGTAQAAEYVDARTVFAVPPHCVFRPWEAVQARLLEAALQRHGRTWIAAGQPYVDTASR